MHQLVLVWCGMFNITTVLGMKGKQTIDNQDIFHNSFFHITSLLIYLMFIHNETNFLVKWSIFVRFRSELLVFLIF